VDWWGEREGVFLSLREEVLTNVFFVGEKKIQSYSKEGRGGKAIVFSYKGEGRKGETLLGIKGAEKIKSFLLMGGFTNGEGFIYTCGRTGFQ